MVQPRVTGGLLSGLDDGVSYDERALRLTH